MNPTPGGPGSKRLSFSEVVRRIFLGNLGTKLMALALAFMLWLYLYATERDSRIFTVAFEPGIAAGADFHERFYVQYWAVYPGSNGEGRRGIRPLQPGDELSINLSGPRAEVERLKNLALRPEFSEDQFQGEKGSGFRHDIQGADLGLDERFVVTGSPQSDRAIAIEVEYQKIDGREVTVLADKRDLQGKPAKGFEIRDVRVMPEKIMVRVPVNEALEEVRIGRIRVDGASESIRINVPIRHEYDFPVLTDPKVPLMAQVVIAPMESEKRFGPVTLRLDGPPDRLRNLELDPTSIFVTVTGPAHLLENIEESHLFVSVPIDAPLSKQDPRREVDVLDLRHHFRIPEGAVDTSLLRVTYMSNVEDPADRKVVVIYSED